MNQNKDESNNIINTDNIIINIDNTTTNNTANSKSNININKNNNVIINGNNNDTIKHKSKYGRCAFCNKKLKMINFTCKCELKFCILHQNPHKHNCKFDSVKEKKQFIIDNNPKLSSKFIKI